MDHVRLPFGETCNVEWVNLDWLCKIEREGKRRETHGKDADNELKIKAGRVCPTRQLYAIRDSRTLLGKFHSQQKCPSIC